LKSRAPAYVKVIDCSVIVSCHEFNTGCKLSYWLLWEGLRAQIALILHNKKFLITSAPECSNKPSRLHMFCAQHSIQRCVYMLSGD